MALARRKNLISSRRKRDDEGEEEGSQAGGDVDDDSLSEGSISSNGEDDADIEGSDISEDNGETVSPLDVDRVKSQVNGHAGDTTARNVEEATQTHFTASKDTQAMMNGLKISGDANAVDEINFEDMTADIGNVHIGVPQSQSPNLETSVNAAPDKPADKPQEPVQKSTLEEHGNKAKYAKVGTENPAYVPTRGGFFLHDNRTAVTGPNGFRPYGRGRGRAFGPVPSPGIGRAPLRPERASQPWTHDLHETISADEPSHSGAIPKSSAAAVNSIALPPRPSVPSTSAPNRSFSTTTVLGNVSVSVRFPGMADRKGFQNVSKKQHTLLPQHRPPLRRDKPVRILIAGQPQPKFIFPTSDRSFIFIPRAMRPNQQAFARGRGRGSITGSRRTSAYGGSVYTPSIAMSRRSSVIGPISRDSLKSPTGSVYSRPPVATVDTRKPVVRLPPAALINGGGPVPVVPPPQLLQTAPMPAKPVLHENRPSSLPMHQPRPQKAVSVADIESPASFTFHPPQQQQEQPFHQQVPQVHNPSVFAEDPAVINPQSRQVSHPSQPSGTPLSQLPDRAVHAQTFQPYPVPPPQGYFAMPYPPGAVFFSQPVGGEYPAFTGTMTPSATAPAFVPVNGHAPGFMVTAQAPQPPPAEQSGQPATVAHESNGMVYYLDPSQLQQQQAPSFAPAYGVPGNGGVVGMGGMMTPPGGYYYPQPPPGPGPVYYTGQ